MSTATTETTKRWLAVSDVAEQLGISVDKVLRMIESGELRAHDLSVNRHLRPRWKIRLSDLETFLARRATTPPPEQRRRRRLKDTGYVDFYAD